MKKSLSIFHSSAQSRSLKELIILFTFDCKKVRSYFYLTFLLFLIQLSAICQSNLLNGGGAMIASRAGMISTLQGGDAIYGNAAGMSFGKNEWMIDAGAEIKFGHQELGTYSLALAKKTELSGMGIKLIQFGDADYLERKISASYSRLLFPKVSIGTSINYNTVSIREYGSSSTPTVDFGVYTVLNKQLDFGATVQQISAISDPITRYPSILALGLRYKPSDKVVVALEAFKVLDRDLTAKTSLTYSPSKDLQIMGGVDIVNQIISFGFAYGASGVTVAGGYSNSPLLPSTPAFNLRYGR